MNLNGVALPDGEYEWVDEFNWNPVRQQIEETTTGALFIEESVIQAGRPITLVWDVCSLGVYKAVNALADVHRPDPMVLNIAGKNKQVRFAYSGSSAVTFDPYKRTTDAPDSSVGKLTVRLMHV